MSRWHRCQVQGCLRPMKAKGLCDAHYNRLRQAHLDPERPIRSLAPRSKKKARHHSVTGPTSFNQRSIPQLIAQSWHGHKVNRPIPAPRSRFWRGWSQKRSNGAGERSKTLKSA
jgi:hypothetical protein